MLVLCSTCTNGDLKTMAALKKIADLHIYVTGAKLSPAHDVSFSPALRLCSVRKFAGHRRQIIGYKKVAAVGNDRHNVWLSRAAYDSASLVNSITWDTDLLFIISGFAA